MQVTGEVWEWRGPAPYHFVTVPEPEAVELAEVARDVTYGWGMVPVRLRLGRTTWTTSLWPRAGGYVVPLKDSVRAAEQVELGDVVTLDLEVAPRRRR